MSEEHLQSLSGRRFPVSEEPLKCVQRRVYRGTSLIRKHPFLGPYSRAMPRALWWSEGGGCFLMSEVPLYLPPGGPVERAFKTIE